jgi:hypothetical protein
MGRGVPDDDMSDSQQSPFGGPAYHERDLDALLSGEPGGPPSALRSVESTLAALRAAPSPRELAAEADARAAFRALTLSPLPLSARPPSAAPEVVTQDTLVLPLGEHLLRAADGRPMRGRRPGHRHRRRAAAWGGHRSAIALASVAVAAVVIAVAITGALPGSFGQMMSSDGHPAGSAASAMAKAGSRRVGSLDGTGTPRATSRATPRVRLGGDSAPHPSPTTTPSASASAAICRAWLASLWQRDRQAERSLFSQLSQLAGGQDKVWGYCYEALESARDKGQRPYPAPHFTFGGYPGGPGGPGGSGDPDPGPGNPGPGYPGGNADGGHPASTSPTPRAGASASASGPAGPEATARAVGGDSPGGVRPAPRPARR